jgi:hypothetical protein
MVCCKHKQPVSLWNSSNNLLSHNQSKEIMCTTCLENMAEIIINNHKITLQYHSQSFTHGIMHN